MKKLNILAIAPYEGMAEILNCIARERDDINLTIRVGNLKEGLEIAAELCQNNEYDVILSRGGTAELIRQELKKFVVEVPLSVYDILRCIKMIENYEGQYAITGFSGITTNARILCDLLQINAEIITFKSSEEVLPTLQTLKKRGFSLVICDMISYQMAQSIGLNTIFVTSGRESINESIDYAIQLTRTLFSIYHERNLFRELLLKTDGTNFILLFDSDKQLVFSSFTENSAEPQIMREINADPEKYIQPRGRSWVKQIGKSIYETRAEKMEIDEKLYYILKIRLKQSMFDDNQIVSVYDSSTNYSGETMSFHSSANLVGQPQELLNRYAPTTFPILITGEVGTGKARAAAIIYENGPYSARPYYVIDCALVNERKWTSLLRNDNSPLNDLHSTIHFKNIEYLENSELEKLYEYIDYTNLAKRNRLIFSITLPNTRGPEIEGYLLNRLSCLLLPLLPLRQRQGDLANISMLYINQMNTLLGKQIVGFEPAAFELIRGYTWTKNLDQFRHVLKELMILSDCSYISAEDVRTVLSQEDMMAPVVPDGIDLNQTLDQIDRDIIQIVLQQEGMNRGRAADRLGISRSTLWRILKN